jgi:hypothetical protein
MTQTVRQLAQVARVAQGVPGAVMRTVTGTPGPPGFDGYGSGAAMSSAPLVALEPLRDLPTLLGDVVKQATLELRGTGTGVFAPAVERFGAAAAAGSASRPASMPAMGR